MASRFAIGTELHDEGNSIQVRVGRNGFSMIKGDWTSPVSVVGSSETKTVNCTIPKLPVDEILPDLGEISCQYR